MAFWFRPAEGFDTVSVLMFEGFREPSDPGGPRVVPGEAVAGCRRDGLDRNPLGTCSGSDGRPAIGKAPGSGVHGILHGRVCPQPLTGGSLRPGIVQCYVPLAVPGAACGGEAALRPRTLRSTRVSTLCAAAIHVGARGVAGVFPGALRPGIRPGVAGERLAAVGPATAGVAPHALVPAG